MRKIILLLLLMISVSSAQKTVHVRQYTRKDGTVVAAHERSVPGTATPKNSNSGRSTNAPSTAHTPSRTVTATPKAPATGRTMTKGQPSYVGPRGGEYHY